MRQFRYNIVVLSAAHDIPVREEMFEGKAHLVVPTVMLLQDVINGCFYPAAEIGKVPEGWSGRPIAVFHPEDTDGAITANSPGIIEERTIGWLFNVIFDPDTTKLGAEMWINIEKAEAISPRTLEMIRNGEPLEVSTGLWTDQDNIPGIYKGKRYTTSVFNFVPDHLAVLPDGQGACDWAMGCGVRMMNARRERAGELEANEMKRENRTGLLKTLGRAMASVFRTEEASHDDVRKGISAKLAALDGNGWVHYIEEVYDGWFVYEASRAYDAPPLPTGSSGQRLYKCSVTVDGTTGEVTLGADAQEVREETTYVPVTSGAGGPAGNAAPGGEKDQKEGSMKKNELIDKLISCPCTLWAENDRKTLEAMPEETLEKLQIPDGVGVLPAEPEKPTPEPEKPVPAPAQNAAQPPKKPATVAEYVANAPPEIASGLKQMVARDAAIKTNAVNALLENKNNTFTQEQLEAKDLTELQALTNLARVEVDFSGQGGGPPIVDDGEAPDMGHTWDQFDESKTS